MASVFVNSWSANCCCEIAEAWTLRNKIEEACCCNSKLLRFFDKSSVVWADAIVVLRSSCRREEPLGEIDYKYYN